MRRVGGERTFAPLASGWRWVCASGVLLAIAGIAALLAPSLTTVTAGIFAGWLLLGIGVAGVVMGARARRHHARWTDLAYGIGSLVAGLVILFDPLAGAASLILALAIWFAIRAAIELGGAVRAGPGQARTVLIVIGTIDLLLGIGLFANWPFAAVKMVGLFLGFGFLLAGAATIATGLQLRRITEG